MVENKDLRLELVVMHARWVRMNIRCDQFEVMICSDANFNLGCSHGGEQRARCGGEEWMSQNRSGTQRGLINVRSVTSQSGVQ